MYPINKQVTVAHQSAIHDGAAQAADLGTHEVGRGGNPVSSAGGMQSPTATVGKDLPQIHVIQHPLETVRT
jgi:hypothetical protein